MKISIVTVVRNSAATLAETIDSVSAQSHTDREHLVVDGGSTDGTLEVIRSREHAITEWISERDRGIYDAMNRGIARATGEVVGLLNADDVYAHPGVLARVAEVFEDPAVDACHGDLVYVDQHDTGKVRRYWRSREYEPGLFERGWMPAHPTFYVRRAVYRRLGLYNLRLKYQADFELTARYMAMHGIRTRHIPEILVRMRTGGTTNRSIGNILRGNRESYAAMKRLGLAVTPLYFVTKFAMRLPQFFRSPAPGVDAAGGDRAGSI